MNMRKAAAGILLSVTLMSAFPEEVPEPYGPDEFPPWQQEVRRGEILAFGALPFITFFSSIYFDLYRYADHHGNEGYLPWPFKKNDVAVPLTEREQKNLFFASAGISLGVAVFDFGFRAVMREIRKSKIEKTNRDAFDPIQIVPISEPESIPATDAAGAADAVTEITGGQ